MNKTNYNDDLTKLKSDRQAIREEILILRRNIDIYEGMLDTIDEQIYSLQDLIHAQNMGV